MTRSELYPLFIEDNFIKIQNPSSCVITELVSKNGILYARVIEDYEDEEDIKDLVDIFDNGTKHGFYEDDDTINENE